MQTTLPNGSNAAEQGTGTVNGRISHNVYRWEFDSVQQAVEDALTDYAQNDYNAKEIRTGMERALSGYSEWGHNFTRSSFLEQLDNPDKGLLDAVSTMKDKLQALVQDHLKLPNTPRRRIQRRLDQGDEIDLDRYTRRELQCWEQVKRIPTPRKVITIACNVSVNADKRPQDLLWRGAAAIALADLLVERGYSVGIVLFKCHADPTDAVAYGVVKYTLKLSSMPMDVSAITFAMAEIAFARIVGVYGTTRHWPGKVHFGFGRSVNLPDEDAALVDCLIEQDVLTQDAAVEAVRAEIEKFE